MPRLNYGEAVPMTDRLFVPVAKLADVPPGKSLAVEVGERSILLANSLDQIFAVINSCSHAQERLECGKVRNGWVSCPVHGARFDLETGEAINPPAKDPIDVFPVRIVGEMIEVKV
jgi:3-phenylpropionate/trans-cinnamate dioxygenase ferredoxin component